LDLDNEAFFGIIVRKVIEMRINPLRRDVNACFLFLGRIPENGWLLLLATVIAIFMQRSLIEGTHVAVIYILAVVAVSSVTTGIFYGLISSVIGVMAVNFIFTFPYFAFNFTLRDIHHVSEYVGSFVITFTLTARPSCRQGWQWNGSSAPMPCM
jgi:fatty acid desaturase